MRKRASLHENVREGFGPCSCLFLMGAIAVLPTKANNGGIKLITDTLDFPVDFEMNNGRIEIHTENEPANARIHARVDNWSIDVYGRDFG